MTKVKNTNTANENGTPRYGLKRSRKNGKFHMVSHPDLHIKPGHTLKYIKKANKNGEKKYQTMKELIIDIVIQNPHRSAMDLTREFKLPNPIYVSKIKKQLGL